jgi:hypothetical protein
VKGPRTRESAAQDLYGGLAITCIHAFVTRWLVTLVGSSRVSASATTCSNSDLSPITCRRAGAQANQAEHTLVGCALHQHKLHLSEVYGLRRDQAGRIFLKNDGLVFHEGE